MVFSSQVARSRFIRNTAAGAIAAMVAAGSIGAAFAAPPAGAPPRPPQGQGQGQPQRPPPPPVKPDDLTEFFGISVADVQAALRGGKSLAQIATDHGKTRDVLKTFILAEAKEYLDADVAASKLSAAQETERLQKLTADLDKIVDRTGPPPPPPARGPRPGATPTATPTSGGSTR